MQLFGMSIGRWILIIVLILVIVQRSNIVAFVANIFYQKKDYETSLKIFRFADKIGNMKVANKMKLGYNYLRLGKVEEARECLLTCFSMTRVASADRYQTKNLLALTSWKIGKIDEGIEALEEVIEDGYKNTMVYQNLGILYNMSQSPKALAFNQEAYNYNKDDAIIVSNLADAFAAADDLEQAEKYYRETIGMNPGFPEPYYGYGKVLLAMGKKEEGLAKIKESLELPFVYLSNHTKTEIEQLYRESQ